MVKERKKERNIQTFFYHINWSNKGVVRSFFNHINWSNITTLIGATQRGVVVK